MTRFTFRPLTRADADAVGAWRYPPPYERYDVRETGHLLRPDYHYSAAFGDDGELVGYCCFGEDARVPGLDESPSVLDVGGALRPDLTGIGLGAPFLRAVCAYGAGRFDPQRFRLVIAAANLRAQRVAAALGFAETGRVEAADGDFIVLERPR